MPTYMTQWNYKDTAIRDLVANPASIDRSEVARAAIESFGGKMLAFYFTLGEYDGLTISEFNDEENALACVLAIFGQGNAHRLKTSTLFTTDKLHRAAQKVDAVLKKK